MLLVSYNLWYLNKFLLTCWDKFDTLYCIMYALLKHFCYVLRDKFDNFVLCIKFNVKMSIVMHLALIIKKTNEKDLKTLSFNDNDKIKGKVNSTKIDFFVYKCDFSLKRTVPGVFR